MLCQGRTKYIRNLVAGETEELYDLTADPDEIHNLAHDKGKQAVLKKFRAAAIAELKRTNAGLVDNLPPVRTF